MASFEGQDPVIAAFTVEDLAELGESEIEALEKELDQLVAVWEIRNLRGQAAIFHDDQHIGEKRRQLMAVQHRSVDKAKLALNPQPLVDSLEGNALIHPLTTPIIEVDETATKARGVWWSIGVEGLAKFREHPMAIISIGFVLGAHVKEGSEWRILWGLWQRTTKNDYKQSWVHSMEPTNMRPPLSPDQDRAFLGRYAYRANEIRQRVPEPPRKDTWQQFPDEMDESWKFLNLE